MKRIGQKLIEGVDQLEKQMRSEIDGEEIRVGYAPSLGGDILRKALGRFSQIHQNVRVTISDSTSEQMTDGLREGVFDLIICVSIGDAELEMAAKA
ncbi:MAG: substrate-binding domain-containing protein [Akkermansiaceae bacterium]|nr:substrate-binding domain-containing protein [Akkermansiaceae bacterium]